MFVKGRSSEEIMIAYLDSDVARSPDQRSQIDEYRGPNTSTENTITQCRSRTERRVGCIYVLSKLEVVPHRRRQRCCSEVVRPRPTTVCGSKLCLLSITLSVPSWMKT